MRLYAYKLKVNNLTYYIMLYWSLARRNKFPPKNSIMLIFQLLLCHSSSKYIYGCFYKMGDKNKFKKARFICYRSKLNSGKNYFNLVLGPVVRGVQAGVCVFFQWFNCWKTTPRPEPLKNIQIHCKILYHLCTDFFLTLFVEIYLSLYKYH